MNESDRIWTTIDGVAVDLVGELQEMLRDPDVEHEIHVGTDTQQDRKSTELVCVVVVLRRSKGGRVFYSREKMPKIRSLRERLMKEVWTSVDVGLRLNEVIPEDVTLTIHIDANPNLKFKSSNHVRELAAMAVSQGFRTLLKPQSWAASHVADHVVKNKVMKL